MNELFYRLLPTFIRGRLESQSNLRKILANTGWLFADRASRMAVGLFVGVWVARYLGPDEFGLYSYVIALVYLLSPLATLGLDGIVVRDIIREPKAVQEILGSAFFVKFVAAFITLLFVVGIIIWLRPEDIRAQWLAGVIAAGMLFHAFDVIDFWFQSRVQSKYSVYAKNAAFMTVSLGKVVLILAKAPLLAFALVGSMEIVLGAAGLVIAYRWNRQRLRAWRVNLGWAKRLVAESWPAALSALTVVVYMKIDQFMLGWMPRVTFKELVSEMVTEDLRTAERDELVKRHGYSTFNSHE